MIQARGFVVMPGVKALNRAFVQAGFRADVVVVNGESGCEFGRRGLAPDNAPELIATATQNLTFSLNTVGRVLGLRRLPSGRPMLTSVGFASNPREIGEDQLVCDVQGAGFFPADNPHVPSLALVAAPQMIHIPQLVPFADAPPVWGAYIGEDSEGKPLVVTFSMQAQWPRLPQNNGNLIRRTVARVKEMVGPTFDYANLWVFVGPGARQYFEFGGTRAQKLSPLEQEKFVHSELVPNPKAGQAGEPESIMTPFLNLQEWVLSIFRTLEVIGRRPNGTTIYIGVPEDQLFSLGHNTVDTLPYASKRTTMGTGPARPGTVIRSNALVGVVRPV